MIQKVSITQLRGRLAHYLAQAQDGCTLVVTVRGKPVARLCGVQIPEGCPPRLADAIAAGGVTWGGGKPKGANLRLSGGGPTLAKAVLDDRD